MYDYVQRKKKIAQLIQTLEQKENELTMKGLDTKALLAERMKLQQESKAADDAVADLLGEARI
jgi:hypothetical protein